MAFQMHIFETFWPLDVLGCILFNVRWFSKLRSFLLLSLLLLSNVFVCESLFCVSNTNLPNDLGAQNVSSLQHLHEIAEYFGTQTNTNSTNQTQFLHISSGQIVIWFFVFLSRSRSIRVFFFFPSVTVAMNEGVEAVRFGEWFDSLEHWIYLVFNLISFLPFNFFIAISHINCWSLQTNCCFFILFYFFSFAFGSPNSDKFELIGSLRLNK